MSAVDQSSVSDRNVKVPKIAMPHIGALVGGRYRIICRLAEGTFGHTYLAKDTHLPNTPECVVKQLKPQGNEQSMQMARRLFETEARMLYELGNHHQIPHLMAHFEQNGEFFLAQEFIDGYPISDELSPNRPWPEANVVPLLEEILQVLTFVHGRRVIHRDLKPGNLIRRKRDGKIVLIDFGAVKEVTTRFLEPHPGETDYTVAIGTVGYIPREQLGGRPRFSSDIFAVGMIGIQALTGIHPNELGEDDRTAEVKWRHRLPHPIHPDLAAILDCMVRYDFRDRYPNAESALQALQALPCDLRQSPDLPWRSPQSPSMPPHPTTLPPTQSFGTEGRPIPATPSGPNSNLDPVPGAIPQGTSLAGLSSLPPLDGSRPPGSTSELNPPAASLSSVSASPSSLPAKPIARPERGGRSPQPTPSAAQPASSSLRHRRNQVATAIHTSQDWLSQSWQVLLIVGGVSLSLMVARGVALASGARTMPIRHLTSINEPVLREASHLLSRVSTPSEPMDDPNRLASNLLKQADESRIEGRSDEALKLYQEALTLDGNLVHAHWGRCAVYAGQNQPEAAMDACHDALAINPNHAPSWWSLAQANEQMGLSSDAAAARERALALDPSLGQENSQTP